MEYVLWGGPTFDRTTTFYISRVRVKVRVSGTVLLITWCSSHISGLFDFDYTWAGILKKIKKDLKKDYGTSSSSTSSSDEKGRQKNARLAKIKGIKRKESRATMKQNMCKLWDTAETVDGIRDQNIKGIYGRLARVCVAMCCYISLGVAMCLFVLLCVFRCL